MNEILSDYQPQTEALRNFGIDVSKEAVDKYTLEKFGELPKSEIERIFARNCKLMEEGMKIQVKMQKTILYISDREEKVVSFLKYLQNKLKDNEKKCDLDSQHDILKTENYDIAGKSFYGNRLGVGYGYCLYYCIDETIDKNKMTEKDNEQLKEILVHVREGAKEVSELEILYMLGLV